MIRFFSMLTLIIGLLVVGCSKDDEDIQALEQETATDGATEIVKSTAPGETEDGDEELVATSKPGEVEKPITKSDVKPAPIILSESNVDVEGFVVQIGSYANYEFAQMMADKYQDRDYPAFVRMAEVNGETVYRLRIGIYDTYEEAKAIGEKLKDLYSATYWVDNNR